MKHSIVATVAPSLAIAALAFCGHAAMAEVAGGAGAEEASMGRGLVPSTNNEVADEVIDTAIAIGAAASQLSDNLIVKGVGIALPALAPGRGLTQAGKLDENPLANAAAMGAVFGAGGMGAGTIAAGLESAGYTQAELYAMTGGNRAAMAYLQEAAAAAPAPSVARWAAGGGLIGAGIGAAIGYDLPGGQAYANATALAPYYPQTTITISIPTFAQDYGTAPLAAQTAPVPAQRAALPQPRAVQMAAPPARVNTVAFPVKCAFDSVIAYAQNVGSCEEAGGVVEPAN